MVAIRRISFIGALSLAIAAIRDGPIFVLDRTLYALDRAAIAIRDFFATAWALFAPEPSEFDSGSWIASVPGGAALDPALLNRMRHEAGMPRRAAPRNI